MDIFKVCLSNSILIEIEWVPRNNNERADYLSRIEDFDDWGISEELIAFIVAHCGMLKIDWFASHYNRKLERFYSRY